MSKFKEELGDAGEDEDMADATPGTGGKQKKEKKEKKVRSVNTYSAVVAAPLDCCCVEGSRAFTSPSLTQTHAICFFKPSGQEGEEAGRRGERGEAQEGEEGQGMIWNRSDLISRSGLI